MACARSPIEAGESGDTSSDDAATQADDTQTDEATSSASSEASESDGTWTSGDGDEAEAEAEAEAGDGDGDGEGTWTTGDGDGEGEEESTTTSTTTEGDDCTSLSLDGSGDYAEMGDPFQLNPTEFTLEAWIRQTGSGETTASGQSALNPIVPVITKGRTGGDGGNDDLVYFLGVLPDGRLGGDFEDGGGGNHTVEGATSLNMNTWYHIALTYDGATLALYVDGELDGSESYNDTPTQISDALFAVGTSMNPGGTPAGFFEGQIDEVRVWDQARSETEIADNMDVKVTSGNGLVASWPFDAGMGDANDQAGSADANLGGDAELGPPGAICE